MVEVIPVLDIREGMAVGGKSGDRDSYSSLKSVFSAFPDPLALARSLPFDRLYVADLDGIVNNTPDIPTLRNISLIKNTMFDLGVRINSDLTPFYDLDCKIVLGTETVESESVIDEALETFDDRIILSIDIMEKKVLSGFLPSDPVEVYERMLDFGFSEIIFLDISSVGTLKSNFGFIKNLNKTGKIILGGGIKKEDINILEKTVVDGVLVGTALHNGQWM